MKKIIYIFVILLFLSVQLAAESASSWNQKGVEATQNGNWKDACTYFENAYRLDSQNEVIEQNLYNSYISYSNYLSEKKEFNNALTWANRALQLRPNSKEIYRTLSIIYGNYSVTLANEKDWADASDAAYKAYSYNPNNKTLKSNYSNIMLNYAFSETGRNRKNILANVLKIDPNNEAALIGYADILYNEDEIEDALRYYGQALNIDPDNDMLKMKYRKIKKEYDEEKDYRTTKRQHFIVKYEGIEKMMLAGDVLNILNEAYYMLRNKVGFYSKRKLTVILYTGSQFSEYLGIPDWTGGLYDGKIRVREGDVGKNNTRLKDILYHEYTHALIHERVGNDLPVWFNEGFAQYNEPSRKWTTEFKKRIAESIGSSKWMTIEDISKPFVNIQDSAKARQAYDESYSIIYYLSQNFGDFSFVRMLNYMNMGKSFEDSFKQVYYMDLKTLDTNWKFFLKSGF